MWGTSSYLAGGVVRRERIHRRAVMLGIATLIVLSGGPLLGHHLTDGFERVMTGRDHLGALCLVALHALLEPVHDVFHLLLATGLVYALWDRARAWRGMRETLASLTWRPPERDDPFCRAATAGRVSPSRLRIVDGLPTAAFTVGFLRPVIYVAAELPARLSPRELAAVVAHEGAHAARRDPLRLSLLRFLARTLFWLPAMQGLADDFTDDAEIAADDAAARLALPSAPLTLAAALVTTAATYASAAAGSGSESGIVGLTGGRCGSLLDRRVLRLAGEDTPVRSHLTGRSVAFAAAMLVLVWVSSVAVAHPLPGHGASSHCQHEGGSPLAHLFCRGAGHVARLCPHAGS